MLTVAEFKKDFSEFNAVDNSVIESLFTEASMLNTWVDDSCGCGTSVAKRINQLLVAHILQLSLNSQNLSGINTGGAGSGMVTSASIGDVSVSFAAPPASATKDAYDYWLSQTQYGQRLLALLQAQVGGGVLYTRGSLI